MTTSYPIIGLPRSEYTHEICLGTDGVPMVLVEWCRNHCQSDCGWRFVGRSSYMGFERLEDLTLCALSRAEITHG
jgi:hypothetical protein